MELETHEAPPELRRDLVPSAPEMLRPCPSSSIWILPAGCALVDWYAVARDDRCTEVWAKPLVMISLIVVALTLGATDDTAGRWLLVALVLGLVGDIALLSESMLRFQVGLGELPDRPPRLPRVLRHARVAGSPLVVGRAHRPPS